MTAAARFQPSFHVPGEDGLYFTWHFSQAGMLIEPSPDAAWVWRCHLLTDLRTRQAIAHDAAVPAPVREAFLAGGRSCHLAFEDDWLFGELPDFRHDYAGEAPGLANFRFALDGKTLVIAAKQPLRSIEKLTTLIMRGPRAFRRPVDALEALLGQSLDGLAADLVAVAERLDAIEDRIVVDSWHNEREALVEERRRLVAIHRQMASLNGPFRHLDYAHRDDLPEYMADSVARLSQRALSLYQDGEAQQARARLLQDELMAKLQAQSNRLLYVLSVMTAVLMPMTIISGLFGMNVGGLPFLDTHYGFWIVTALSFAVAAALYGMVARAARGK